LYVMLYSQVLNFDLPSKFFRPYSTLSITS